MSKLRCLMLGLALVLAVVSCGGGDPEPYAGYQRTPVPNVAQISLPAVGSDGSIRDFSFRAPDGELLLVYFGYTSCPDVCPTTLSDVRQALVDLGSNADRIGLAMVTIDPEVDDGADLERYVQSFVPTATALRTDLDAELRAAADAFGADYGRDEENGVFHTASLYVVDDGGNLVLTWPFGTKSSSIRTDLSRLLSEVA